MKKYFLFVLLLFRMTYSISQTSQPVFTLEKFAPKITRQDGSNCYAYSAAYVALTIQIAYSKSSNLDSSSIFSFGYVDGYKSYLIKKLGIDSFNKRVNHAIYNDTAEIIGNLDYVFYILKEYGTVKFSEFPYTRHKQIIKCFKQFNHYNLHLQKIKSVNEIFKFGQEITNETIYYFKSELLKGKPIICSIEQPKASCDWGDISKIPRTTSSMGNHIVTIIGYNNDKFLIKNNYHPTCVTEYSMVSFLNMLGWAYTFNL
ncbi:hypothetical protein L0U88_20605 [Flavihumibacter sp. RY-1]|uniref:Peptidase C39-like domain-containing protein n=1 Tax=Flavihumibacter fluminis TaxID=2909236 RepID=A0ABS9BR06_9BACT|nr:hypothetical protein [Flavihumibacter fluminis]MCF1717056.1 hypothetical protein [Flavihumibacter fluminis]